MTDWFTDDNDNVHEANINKVADAGITLGIGGGTIRRLSFPGHRWHHFWPRLWSFLIQ